MLGAGLTMLLLAAQSSPPPSTISEAAIAVERLCSTEGSMEHGFGSAYLDVDAILPSGLGMPRRMAEPLAPFTHARVRLTPWTNRLAFVEFEVQLDRTDGAAALDRVTQAAEAAGWRRDTQLENPGSTPLFMAPVAGERVFRVDETGEVVAGLSYAIGKLTLVCGRRDLLRTNAEESFGRLPEGTPRPASPPPLPTAQHRREDCAEPAVQDATLVVLDGEANEALARLMQRTQHAQRLHQWKAWRLSSSGRVTPRRMVQLLAAGLESGSPGGNMLAGFERLGELVDVAERVWRAENAGDRAAACRAAFDLAAVLTEMEHVAANQWRAMDAAVEAEARRVGVGLD